MFPRLCQRSACSNPLAGRDRPDRQSRLAQGPENQESDRGRGRRTAFPAALLARPEPDRDGFFEIEDAPAKKGDLLLGEESPNRAIADADIARGKLAPYVMKRQIGRRGTRASSQSRSSLRRELRSPPIGFGATLRAIA